MAAPLLWAYHVAVRIAPWLLTRAARHAHTRQDADPARLPERLGRAPLPRPEGPLIWLHAESVGEVNACRTLLAALNSEASLLVTTNTATGARQTDALGLSRLIHQFKPVDTPAATSAFLDHWQPDLALFAENDMPPTMLVQLARRGIPRALIAARPSKTRARAPRMAAALLAEFDLITASSPVVADEIEALGAPVALVEDLKAIQVADAAPLPWPEGQLARPLWLAVSTHPEDHALLFAAHDQVLAERPDALLAIAPRHPQEHTSWAPERFSPAFFSHSPAPAPGSKLFVMDAFGHLPGLHAMSHVSFIGGSLGQRGGHSPWEAAAAGSVILTGPDVANNAPAYAQLAYQIVETPDALASAVLAAWDKPRPAPVTPSSRTGATLEAVLALLKGARR